MAKDAIKMTGKIVTVHSMSKYSVKLENNQVITGITSGRIRVHHIRILPGDVVDVELSPYDLTKCRIIYRH